MRGSNYGALTGKIFALWRDGRLQERWGHTWRFNSRSFSLDDSIEPNVSISCLGLKPYPCESV